MATNEQRITNEKRVFKKAVETALRLGYMVSLYDGEEYTVKRSRVKADILAAGQTTDMDRLTFRLVSTGEIAGGVLFVYGNLGSEVINDWSDNAETNAILADALAYMEKLSAKSE